MAAGLPDLVDCARLAEDAAVINRIYELEELPRLKDVLAEPSGTLAATFVFRKLPGGRVGAQVRIQATPRLICQRCLQGFACSVAAGSEVEFADAASADAAREAELAERELFETDAGQVSLRDLAEEELLLSLPVAPACDIPRRCGKAPSYALGDAPGAAAETRRPFSALQDLLKKT